MFTKPTTEKPDWPSAEWPSSPKRIRPPTRYERLLIRFLIFCATILTIGFAVWLFRPDHWGDLWLVWPLNLSFALVFLSLLGEWWYYWRIEVPELRKAARPYTVDIFTTACPGEPPGMIVRTLSAMQKITYPHTSYLCDEGDDPYLKSKCAELGVVHVTRTLKVHAKAGNINNALSQSSGEICIILDPDHEPAPFMIDRLLGYFDDESIGFVQSIQAYRNQDSTLVARGAAEMQYHFYGPIEMGMHGAGTAQAIGANCAFRRTALDSIGGHAAGLAEDMHTTMRLYAAGWKGSYVPEILTRGLVPQTLGAFYKQQLKWSCGSFDLFFQVLPKVFKSLSWYQRLHFALCPLFFLQGWITFFGTLVPILCLLFGGIAWKITGETFFTIALPLLLLVILIRMVAQRFLAEPSERGFHLMSGILSAGTWWVFSVGNICALLRRKIPYLPTPKDDWAEDAWKISIPNITLGLVSLAAIPIGLVRDFSPYSGLMSFFAAWNAVSLLTVVAISQQKTNQRLRNGIMKWMAPLRGAWFTGPVRFFERQLQLLHKGAHTFLRERPLVFFALVAAAFAAFALTKNKPDADLAMAWAHLVKEEKELGGFYTGFYAPADFNRLEEFNTEIGDAEKLIGQPFDIASTYVAWGPESIDHFPKEQLDSLISQGKIPMITWEPWTETFPWTHEQNLPLAKNEGIFRNIAAGAFDYYIIEFARKMRELRSPVFLRFGHEMDNPQYPWSENGKLAPKDFIEAWRRIRTLCNQQGASNITFVYNPWRGEAMDRYYPGDQYVDWIGLTLLNYGKAGRDRQWHDFESLYEEFHRHAKIYAKPVMLAEFGSTPYGGDAGSWLADAFEKIGTTYPQIRAAVLFHTDNDKNWATNWRPDPSATGIDWSVLHNAGARGKVADGFASLQKGSRPHAGIRITTPVHREEKSATVSKPYLTGAPGSNELLVDGKPFYIKGVAYNPGHDWRDGSKVLSKRELDKDFSSIKAMGANTIRRYSGGWGDYNLFNAADKAGLKVIYGLWLPHDIDYAGDSSQLDELEKGFDDLIANLKDEPSLLAWVIGNETWGGLKHTYDQPYLTEVRWAYVQFVERLARRIRTVDPNRPIMVACEHTEELAGALSDYTRLAPTVNVLGINSFYREHLENLQKTVAEFGDRKPYVVTEFGPDGYWHSDYSPRSPGGLLLEPSARGKAAMYESRWNSIIQPNRGHNLGGVAYCWSDRYEGSSSWFGIVARDGIHKPAYAALQHAWTGKGREHPSGPKIDKLVVSKQVVAPGEIITAEAFVSSDRTNRPIEFGWKVMEGNYEEAHADLAFLTPGRYKLNVVMPKEKGRYWIHLHVSDQAGKMDEIAAEIRVKDTLSAEPGAAIHPSAMISSAAN
jgi:cellulose synthase (UDP-forming)